MNDVVKVVSEILRERESPIASKTAEEIANLIGSLHSEM